MEKKTPVQLRGKAALRSIQVKHEANVWERLYNSYIYTLRLPLPFFFLIMFSTPLLVSFVFTGFYLLDVDGLAIPQDELWRTAWVAGVAGETEFKVFVFSLSLCTTFGGTGVEARSPYNLVLANLNTLTAQLIFVFLSGAGTYDKERSLTSSWLVPVSFDKGRNSPVYFEMLTIQGILLWHADNSCTSDIKKTLEVLQESRRMSQPGEPVRWAKTALITDDRFTEHADKILTPGKKSHKSFIIRVNLADPAKTVLIECKFEVIYRCILTPDGSHSPFITQVPLRLVRPEVSYLQFCFIIRHIIDESSPLYGMDFEMFKVQDASFTITMLGTERSSMQPIFSENLYTIADGDVLWDRQYEDQIVTNKHGQTVFSAYELDHLKPLDEDCKDHDVK